ncbi:MAG: TatD-related deoxyribonuclease [Thermococcaceae archaeon]|nr:TatD-related deoxyribonuclease [Thermococcaceae archaeon]
MIIFDNHFHVDPFKGLFLEAVKEFHKAGGTHLNVVYKSAHDYGFEGVKAEDFMKAMDFHISLVERINKETPVKAFAVVGVHPAEFAYLAEKKGVEYAKNEVMKALEYAQKLELMKYGMELAKEADCAVQLHTESFNEEKFRELGAIIKEVGIKPYKVVKHYSPPLVKVAEEVGVFPSILASKKSIMEALMQGSRFLMETDYIDDKRRPGAVLGPKTVPKRTKAFIQQGLMDEETAYRIHVENPEKVYGVEMEE